MRQQFVLGAIACHLLTLVCGYFDSHFLWFEIFLVPLTVAGIFDLFQTKHTIRRNFPLVGNIRYLLEAIRPEINQYFVESNFDGAPFSRELRSLVYQRAKKQRDTIPFGTQHNVYATGYEWAEHSLAPVHVDTHSLRVVFGGPQCTQPYSASILNISAMSFGALSKNAVLALNGGARLGNFAHNTGEGGLSPYHAHPQGDIIWQIGTAYFGCRTEDGFFSEELFERKAQQPQIKMIEIKLSQGAKPSHGGILPGAKVTKEIAEIRGVIPGKDVISPPAHTAFSTPEELLKFVEKLRKLSGGKPVGFKLCIGKRSDFISIAKAMRSTGILPDFITVDGGEGGTGAAPLEFSNGIGFPLRDGLVFVHNVLVGMNLRKDIRLIAAGKVISAMDILVRLALGADTCNSARGMMLALGCIQALRCNSNRCPTGVATQDPALIKGLDVADKRHRVANYHQETLKSLAEILGALGLKKASDIRPHHIRRRIGISETAHLGQVYTFLKEGDLLGPNQPEPFQSDFGLANEKSF